MCLLSSFRLERVADLSLPPFFFLLLPPAPAFEGRKKVSRFQFRFRFLVSVILSLFRCVSFRFFFSFRFACFRSFQSQKIAGRRFLPCVSLYFVREERAGGGERERSERDVGTRPTSNMPRPSSEFSERRELKLENRREIRRVESMSGYARDGERVGEGWEQRGGRGRVEFRSARRSRERYPRIGIFLKLYGLLKLIREG